MSDKISEPVGSMGDDTPLAVISKQKRKFYDYFKQQFAQVTNPPIDSLREKSVMSLLKYLGSEDNLLNDSPSHKNAVKIFGPILSSLEVKILLDQKHWFSNSVIISALNTQEKLKDKIKLIQCDISNTGDWQDYFENVDDKSFYQSQSINGMKREINDYSERLHNLQTRFDEIFYGLSRGGSFQKPFDTELLPTRPERKSLYDPKVSISPGLPSFSNRGLVSPGRAPADLFEPEEQNPVNQLAFQVEAPGTYTEGGQTKPLFNPKSQASNRMGKYFILTPGYALSLIHI